MTADESRSLADQAADWVPPWARKPSDNPDLSDATPPTPADVPGPDEQADQPPSADGEPASGDIPDMSGEVDSDSDEPVDEPAAEAMELVDEPAAEAMEPADEPLVEAMESADEPVAEAVEPVDEPVAEAMELVDEPVAEEMEPADELVAEVMESTDEPVAERPDLSEQSDESDLSGEPADLEEAEPETAADDPSDFSDLSDEVGALPEVDIETDALTNADADAEADALADASAEGAPLAEGEAGAELVPVSDEELRGAVEAILLVIDEPTTEIILAQVLEQPVDRINAVIAQLTREYAEMKRGFELRRVAGGYRLYTRPEFAAYVEKFVLDGQQVRLTQAALETLAVVAYKQPVTRSRISAIRGVNCDGVVRTLVARGLIEECGSEPESGAFLYRTTVLFLEKLGLDSVDQLPPLAPFLPDDVDEIADAQR